MRSPRFRSTPRVISPTLALAGSSTPTYSLPQLNSLVASPVCLKHLFSLSSFRYKKIFNNNNRLTLITHFGLNFFYFLFFRVELPLQDLSLVFGLFSLASLSIQLGYQDRLSEFHHYFPQFLLELFNIHFSLRLLIELHQESVSVSTSVSL